MLQISYSIVLQNMCAFFSIVHVNVLFHNIIRLLKNGRRFMHLQLNYLSFWIAISDYEIVHI